MPNQASTDTPGVETPTVYDKAKAAADAADHATNKAALDEALLGKPTPSTPGKPGNEEPRKRTREVKPDKPKPRTKPATKGAKAKAAGTKPAAKKNTKPTKGKAAKPAAPSTGKRKDEPIKGELKGASLANYAAVLKVLPKLPADAMNANQIAAKLSKKAGKTVWPIPTKKYLETAVDRDEAVKLSDRGRALYHLPTRKAKGGS
jgi:hypothetical protein